MACAASVSDPRKVVVKIRNPVPGGATHIKLKRAREHEEKGRGYLDSSGQFVFHGRPIGGKTSCCLEIMDRHSGVDAFPDRAVLPPSPTVLSRDGNSRRALRPPVSR